MPPTSWGNSRDYAWGTAHSNQEHPGRFAAEMVGSVRNGITWDRVLI